MSKTTLQNLLNNSISKILSDRTTFYLEPTATIIETVKLLTDKQIQSAPVLLKKNADELDCLGFVDIMDCVVHVLDQVDAHLRGQADFRAFTNSILCRCQFDFKSI
jgi:predicted transcriptional regulator